jgi:hypothetical protein
MAIDTAAKRASAINPGSPWRAHVPFPDGAIGQGDRQAVAFWYSGILAGAAAAQPSGRLEYTLPDSRLKFTLPDSRLKYTATQ